MNEEKLFELCERIMDCETVEVATKKEVKEIADQLWATHQTRIMCRNLKTRFEVQLENEMIINWEDVEIDL